MHKLTGAARYALLLTTSYQRPILPPCGAVRCPGGGVGALMASRRFGPLVFFLSIFAVSASAQTLPTAEPSSGSVPPAAITTTVSPGASTGTTLPTIRVTAKRKPPPKPPASAPASAAARSAAPPPPSPYETGAPNVAGGTPVVPQLASQMTISGARSQRPAGYRTGASARSRAGARRRPAFRRRQGQPVLPTRLQSRSRHRHGDILGRRADQPANERARPRLHGSQLSHSGNDQRTRGPQRTLFRRRRRLRQCRRPSHLAARQRPAEYPIAHRRQLRLRSLSFARLDQTGRRVAALRGRIQHL